MAETHPDSDSAHDDIHLPSPSIWPLVMALGLMICGYGIIFLNAPLGFPLILPIGVVVFGIAMAGWISDIRRERHGSSGH